MNGIICERISVYSPAQISVQFANFDNRGYFCDVTRSEQLLGTSKVYGRVPHSVETHEGLRCTFRLQVMRLAGLRIKKSSCVAHVSLSH